MASELCQYVTLLGKIRLKRYQRAIMVNKSCRKGYLLGLKGIDRLRSCRGRLRQGEETGRSCRKKRSGRKTLRRLLFHAFDACKNHDRRYPLRQSAAVAGGAGGRPPRRPEDAPRRHASPRKRAFACRHRVGNARGGPRARVSDDAKIASFVFDDYAFRRVSSGLPGRAGLSWWFNF